MHLMKFNAFFGTFFLIFGYATAKIGDSNALINTLMKDDRHGIKMGIAFDGCDNARDNLDTDWDESPINFTCYHPKNPYPIQKEMESIEECEELPQNYSPQHFCMNKKILYNTTLPTHGDHRPLWPVFGEYKFVPPQRWLHNVEHGAVIMLYHPCAHPAMVNRLRAFVRGCIRKHIISKYNLLTLERPLALISWGCRLQMNYIDPVKVVSFIKRRSMKGPEGTYPKEGQYTKYLLRMAKPPKNSDYSDARICPGM